VTKQPDWKDYNEYTMTDEIFSQLTDSDREKWSERQSSEMLDHLEMRAMGLYIPYGGIDVSILVCHDAFGGGL
jgi:hypothetical protein